MRRKETFSDPKRIEEIIRKCTTCFVGMVDQDGLPYVLPFNFGYQGGMVYLHSAQSGRKMDILKQNPRVCVAFSTDHQMGYQHPDVACSYLMRYRSVLIEGRVEFIEDPDEKAIALNHIMQTYTGRDFSYGRPSLNEVAVYKVEPLAVSGRQFGY